MAVFRNFVRGVMAVALVSIAAAQTPLGSAPPVPDWGPWLQGEPLDLAKSPPACTVVAFYTPPRDSGVFVGDGDAYAELQRRCAARGLVVVAVVGDPSTPVDRWPGCRVVVDPGLATTTAWFVDPREDELRQSAAVLVLDRVGKVAFHGGLECGAIDAVQAILDGKELTGFGTAASLRAAMLGNYDDLEADGRETAQRVAATVPHDGYAWALAYLLTAVKVGDRQGAQVLAGRAVNGLADEPRALAAFADLALRGDPGNQALLGHLREPLAAVAARLPRDPVIQLAFLRLLVQAGDGREVGKHAARIRKHVTASPGDCLDFAGILTTDREPAVHRDLAAQAVDRAQALGADPRLVTAVRYAVARFCANDAEAGKRLLDAYVAAKEGGATLNSDCWYLMTEVRTMGRFTPFALGLAERMLADREAMDAAEHDTAAMAMFLAGRVAEAVELQELAMHLGGTGNPRYEARLQRYRAASAAPVR